MYIGSGKFRGKSRGGYRWWLQMVAITGGGVEGGGPGLVVRFLLIIWSFQPVHEFIYSHY